MRRWILAPRVVLPALGMAVVFVQAATGAPATIGCLLGSAADTARDGTSTPSTRPPVPTLATGETPLQGVPAIRPSIAPSDPLAPTFTKQDVRVYLRCHPHPDRDPAAPAPAVERIEFLASGKADRHLDLRTGLPADYPVCVVREQGRFIIYGPPPGHRSTYRDGYRLFDGRTGNLLVMALRDALRATPQDTQPA
jgi:hypothetical protein